jgi:hypothetical protein
MYIALAVQLGGPAVAADQKLFNALTTTAWAGNIRWIADVP